MIRIRIFALIAISVIAMQMVVISPIVTGQIPQKRDTITVDVSKVIKDTRRWQTGINTCILTDDDIYL